MTKLNVLKRTIVTFALVATSWGVAAQQQVPDGFKPFDENAPRETLPAAPLVFVAYSLAWVALAFYAFTLFRKVTKLETDLAELRRAGKR
jgi:CcmD family protein